MADLTTVANVKSWAQINGSGSDASLGRLVTSASTWISDVTSRNYASQAISEIRDGTGGTEMLLSGPVVSITSLTIATIVIPAQPADGQAGYFLAGDVLSLYSYTFTAGRKNVRVSYTAGYASTPGDIEQACIEMVVSAYRRGQRGPDLQSRSASGQGHSWSLEDMPNSVRKVLDRYSKVAPI